MSRKCAAPSAVVFSPREPPPWQWATKLQLLTGLSGSLTVQDLAIPPDAGEPTAIALSDDAQFVFFRPAPVDTASTWLLSPGMSPLQLALPGPIAVASFQPGARDAFTLDLMERATGFSTPPFPVRSNSFIRFLRRLPIGRGAHLRRWEAHLHCEPDRHGSCHRRGHCLDRKRRLRLLHPPASSR